ncbi:uncharacterized protein LOC112220968 isoform X2 [Oncorhynchus tshawytscha]|uniref:uncharacterized protein LOC112220968 isoform X2 n=1 Tax=Oncorhynchus tshawytscha TaxID=74940 RepID=UPI000D0A26D6|nr:uncharacterized protein LOC112220968 isoform X2 [Oncorhynchus tshawytscha]
MDAVTEVTGAGDRSGSAKSSSEVGLQQHVEGELSDIQDHFLRSFEQQVAASNPVAQGEGEGSRSTASLSEPYTALRNYSGAQMVTSTAEHRTQSTQVREEQSYTHTAYTHPSYAGQSNTHVAQVYMPQPEPSYTHTAHIEQCNTVTHPTNTHLPLSHTSPLPYSTPNSVQPNSALPPTSLPPSPGEERRVMTRRRLRGEINIQPIVRPKKCHGERNIDRTRLLIKKKKRIKKGYSMKTRNCKIVSGPLLDVDDVLLGVSVRTGEKLCQPEDAARETPTPQQTAQSGRSAEKIKSQTKARPAAV